jgi:DHA1 family multidrug resistance protein-like MFS transporter
MVERAMFGGAILLFLMALVTNAEQLVILRAIQGAITGTIAAANALIAAKVPKQQTGYAMGLLQVGFTLGIAIGPLIGGPLADQFGYSMAFYATAVMLFLSGVLVLFGFKEDFIPVEKNNGQKGGIFANWGPVFRSPGITPSFALRFLSSMGRMMVIPIVPLFIRTLLVDASRVNTIAGISESAVFGTTTISAIYLSRLGDRIGHRKIVIASLLITALIYIPQMVVRHAWQVIVLQALVGVALGGVVPSLSALLARFSKAGDEGTVYGLDNSINSGGRAVAPLLGSAIAAWTGYRWVFPASAAVFFLSGLIAWIGLPKNELQLDYEYGDD